MILRFLRTYLFQIQFALLSLPIKSQKSCIENESQGDKLNKLRAVVKYCSYDVNLLKVCLKLTFVCINGY